MVAVPWAVCAVMWQCAHAYRLVAGSHYLLAGPVIRLDRMAQPTKHVNSHYCSKTYNVPHVVPHLLAVQQLMTMHS